MRRASTIKVLIVDDSAVTRALLTRLISEEADMEVVGTAPDPFVARDQILALQPDVVTLDIEMPRMDGVTFLRHLMRYHPLPVIIVSTLGHFSCRAALEAFRAGAIDVLAKPDGKQGRDELGATLRLKIRGAAAARLKLPVVNRMAPPPRTKGIPAKCVIAIGASTGGIAAIQETLVRMPKGSPPIVVTQHIPPVFSTAFASRLNEMCSVRVREARDGDFVAPGLALIAPGGMHMTLRKAGGGYRVRVAEGAPVCYSRPSVDVLFNSVAEAAGAAGIGVLLTGMGTDGACGLLQMKRAGARTIVQDEETCVVFGMPAEAIRLGAAGMVLPLHEIPAALL